MAYSPRLKDKYKEVFEIDPKWLIRAAAFRGKWIDQSQSLNIFYGGKSGKEINDMYVYAWDMGIKTTYYLRTMAASQVEKSTVDTAAFGNTHVRGDNTGSNAKVDQPDAQVPATAPEPVAAFTAMTTTEVVQVSETEQAVITTTEVEIEEVVPQAETPSRAGTFKVEPSPISAMNAGFSATATNSVATLSASDLKLCRLDDPECEACQ